jgi:hypothetical protein
MTVNRRTHLFALALVLAGCATPGLRLLPVATGEAVVRERLAVTPAAPWNQVEGASKGKLAVWTKDGLPLDQLTFYVGIADGEPLVPPPTDAKTALPPFRAKMTASELVDLLQVHWTQNGANFKLERVERKPFAGQPGFRLEYSYLQADSEVRRRGVAWGAVVGTELFIIDWMAPRLAFFDRYAAEVEALAGTARLVR